MNSNFLSRGRFGSQCLVASKTWHLYVAGLRATPGRNIPCCASVVQNASPQATVGTCPFEYGVKAEQGLRDSMEDEVQCYWDKAHNYLYLGCYDGHGGGASAQWIREHLHLSVAERMKEAASDSKDEMLRQMSRAFQDADDALLKHLEDDEVQRLTGTTATVALVKPDKVVVANVGDSQAFIMRADRSLVPLVTPHRLSGAESAAEVDRIQACGAWEYDGRVCNVLAVSRAFGDWEFKGRGLSHLLETGVERGFWPASFAGRISFKSDPLIVTPDTAVEEITEEDEFLVVSTDGLWDVMPGREAMMYARRSLMKGMRPQQVAESLIQVALKRYTSDNTSVMVVDFKGPEYWQAMAKKSGMGGGLFSFLFK